MRLHIVDFTQNRHPFFLVIRDITRACSQSSREFDFTRSLELKKQKWVSFQDNQHITKSWPKSCEGVHYLLFETFCPGRVRNTREFIPILLKPDDEPSLFLSFGLEPYLIPIVEFDCVEVHIILAWYELSASDCIQGSGSDTISHLSLFSNNSP